MTVRFQGSVCGILLMASSAYFNSIDPLAMARRSFPYGEIRLELGDYGPQAHNSEQYSELQKSNLLTEDFRESILDIDGVEEIKKYQGTVLNVRMPTGDIEPVVSDAYMPSSQKLLLEYQRFQNEIKLDNRLKGPSADQKQEESGLFQRPLSSVNLPVFQIYIPIQLLFS